jgi:hypothetical protein
VSYVEDFEPDWRPDPGNRVLSERRLTARLPHNCDACDTRCGIEPGDAYTQVVELSWGRFFIRRYCIGGCGLTDEPAPPRAPAYAWGPDELPF